jgi:hypothetical protein
MRAVKCAELNLFRSSPSLATVLDWALHHHKADRMFVVIPTKRGRGRWNPDNPQVEKAVSELFAPFILRVFLAASWPPTSHPNPDIVCVMRYSHAVRDIILKREPNFSGWEMTEDLPEDICLFNSRRKLPAAMSSIHDGAAWLIDPTGIEGDFFHIWEDTPAAIRRQLNVKNGYAFCRAWPSQRHIGVEALREFVNAKPAVPHKR